MRARHPVLAGLCALGLACTIRTQSGSSSTPPQDPPKPVAGPGDDPCAAYVERVATGVRCQAIDHARCQCELVGATPPPTDASANTPPPDTGGGAVTPTNPPPSTPTATLEFAKGPSNTIVQCISGPCPTRSADFITEPYPPIPVAAGGTSIQLEFRALDYKPYVGTYNLVPGRNQITFTLEREFDAPKTATFSFQGGPSGLTVECISGPCVDKKAYAPDKFPELPLSEDGGTLLLRFKAPGYRTATTSFQVRRGANVVPVLMEQAPLGK